MVKPKLLLGLNCVLFVLMLLGLITSDYSFGQVTSIEIFLQIFAANIVFLFALVLNGFLIHRILIKKQKDFPVRLHIILTVTTFLWLILLFVGYFLASSLMFPVLCIICSFIICKYSLKLSKKIAIVLLVLNIVVSILIMVSSFEEDYCWDIGTAADFSGTEEVAATKDDVSALPAFNLTEGQMIRTSFRAHMLCHTTYHFSNALKEKYVFQN